MINLKKSKNIVILFIFVFLFGIFLMFTDKFQLDSNDKQSIENDTEKKRAKIVKIQSKSLQRYYLM